MPNQNIKVEIGQIWKHETDPRAQYYIQEFRPSPYPDQLDVLTCLIYRNKNRNGNRIYKADFFGRCWLDGTPKWPMAGWTIVPVKKFTHINPKSLKKKIRDQLAQQVLVGANDPSPNGAKT